MVVPVFLYVCEGQTMRKNDSNKIKAVEMKYLREVKAWSKEGRVNNEDVWKDLSIFSVNGYRNKYGKPFSKDG